MESSSFKIYSSSRAAWDAMRYAIVNAKKSIYWELYIFIDDDAGKGFFDILEMKAKEGLDVKLILDWFGSISISRSRIASLKKSGVDVRFFQERKHRYRGIWSRLISRTHKKVLVVDERIGFIGGVNIQKHMRDWLDIQMRIKGSVVRSLLRSFAKMYLICGGEKKDVLRLLKYKFHIKQNEVDFVYDDADAKRSRARKKYIEALRKAKERVIFFSPYYFPDKAFLKALWMARKRGIKIDLLIPLSTDLKIAKYAAYAWFELLKERGINIHLTKKMMHGKGVVVDDNWAVLGSSNIEYTSFYDNYEANVRISHKKTVKRLKNILLDWMEKSQHLDLDEWKNRSRAQKIKEIIASKLYQIWHRHS